MRFPQTIIIATATLFTTGTLAEGINCHGSGFCGKDGAPNTLQGYIGSIDLCRIYSNGEHIACVSAPNVFDGKGGYCAFLQNTPNGMSGAAIQLPLEPSLTTAARVAAASPSAIRASSAAATIPLTAS